MSSPRPIGMDLVRVTARARSLLDRQALARLAAFVASRAVTTGGFQGRSSAADLYYTLFGVAVGTCVGASVDRRSLSAFLERQPVACLDLPHLAAFVQCQRWLHLLGVPRRWRDECAAALAARRSDDGGFGDGGADAHGTAHGLYLAILAHEALGLVLPAAASAAAAGATLLQAELASPVWGLNAVVSAALALQALGEPVPAAQVTEVVTRCRDAEGGFRAHPQAPVPDLLSTAVAAFALRRLGAPVCGSDAALTAGFVESLWDVSGGFCGSAVDPMPDCEYSFYALLALGALEP